MNRRQGVILSYILMIFEVLSTLLLTPFIIRTLGQAEFGVYKLAAAITAYLLLLDLGIGNAITRYIAKFKVENNKEKAEQFLGVATVFYIFISFFAVIVGLLLIFIFPTAFAKGLNEEEIKLAQILLGITSINSAVTLATSAYTNVLIAYEQFKISKGANILQIILRIAMTYLALIFGFGSIGLVIINLVTTLFCRLFFVAYVLFVIKLKPSIKNIEKSFIKEIVVYSGYIFLQMIATQINASVDQILIGSLVASSAGILAVYSIGTQIVQYYQQIGTAFTGVLMPGIVKMVESKSDIKDITNEMIRIGRLILIVLAFIWASFIVVGKEFIDLWAGPIYSQAYLVALILMSAYMLILSEAVGLQVIWAMNQQKELSFLKIGIVISNIFLTIMLIQWDSLIGATIGTFIALVVGDIFVMNIIFAKKIGVDIAYYYRCLFKGILPLAIISVTITLTLKSIIVLTGWKALIIYGIVVSISYIYLLIKYGLNKYEEKLFFSLLGKCISN